MAFQTLCNPCNEGMVNPHATYAPFSMGGDLPHLFQQGGGGQWGGGGGSLLSVRAPSFGHAGSSCFSPSSGSPWGAPAAPAYGGGGWYSGGGGGSHSPFSLGGGGGGNCNFSPHAAVAAAAPTSASLFGGGASGAPRGVLRAPGGAFAPLFGGGGGAQCSHGGARLSFAPEVKQHDGLLPQHAAFDALVNALTQGELAPSASSTPGREQVMALSEHVFSRYARGSAALCAQLMGLSDDLVQKLASARQADEAAAAAGGFRPATVPVLCGGGGSTARLRSHHLPAAIFLQTLVRLACTLHPY